MSSIAMEANGFPAPLHGTSVTPPPAGKRGVAGAAPASDMKLQTAFFGVIHFSESLKYILKSEIYY